ncbi:GNAT family N-acetyltransferase [Paenarthrobacter sp. DKR-5]|uniref:bifunctional acetate--CoA ligase family protein/GNAT family N-acetyltransferase n=1 Tax=Paenarthrobacter sp. DKR-5 TaxID=2835535 RepID=UPI001BDD7745|nr:bifunctional GNAT family N-acetyltransferase/acetate--CoA ligase family protein [Paenarthrobacter sp. DKR-5]MBT1002097.1 GNAT family N-acetyltransferase [Paenarthrobacter sp. DKR-5]
MVELAQPAAYPDYWEADVVLRDGATAHLRPITPADADALQAFHMAQSQNSTYMRFFTYKSKLSGKELRRFTEVDHRDRAALVMILGGEIIGVGRYDRLADPADAEVAFNIADKHQGRGIGSILLEHLAAAARENGIRRFVAEVLPENRKMLTVFSEAGYEVHRHFDDGVVSLEFKLDLTDKSRQVMEAREHRAEARSLAELLAPSSVAVIGASRQWGSIGYDLLNHIVEGGYKGPVHAVNPEALELAGMLSYARIGDVPGPVDLAVVAVPYEEVDTVVRECAAAGVRGVLIASAGYAEAGAEGLARQRELVRHARANGMRVIGPASLGVVNTDPEVSLNASLAPSLPARGVLGLFSQSAALGAALFAACTRRRVGVSSCLSAGNRADVSGNDVMQYWEDDPATAAVGLYFESIGNPRKFSRIARRLARSKPVIVAKSDVMGLQLPPGHAVRTTQAPAGALDAMFRQAGVIRVETNEQLMDIAQIVVSQPLPAGPRLAVFSNSLALGKVVADGAAAHGLEVAQIVTDVDLDAGMSVALPSLKRRLLGVLDQEDVHAAMITYLPARGLTVERIAEVLQECAELSGKPVVAAFIGILDPAIHVEGLLSAAAPAPAAAPWPEDAGPRQRGVPCYASPGAGIAALAAVVGYAQWKARDHGQPALPEGVDADAVAARVEELLAAVPGESLHTLDAAETASLLGRYGITVLPSARFGTPDEAVSAADRLGWPVALKTVDPVLRHRLDLGGVRLNIRDAESLRRNIVQMAELLSPYGSFGMEVQSMAPVGQACTLRAIEDPLLGPVVSFGLAGDAVNLLDDWAHRVPPLTSTDVAEFVRSPRASRKLFGYQGLPPADVAGLEDLVARLALLKDEHPELAYIELNPVVVGTSAVTILAADLKIGNPARRTDSARRAMLG